MDDDELRRLAEAARDAESDFLASQGRDIHSLAAHAAANAAFIAAASPETVKRLLDRVAKAEADALAAHAAGRIAGMEEAARIALDHWKNGGPPVECAAAIRAAAKEITNDR